MVCPMCITAAVVSNAPLIGAALSGVAAAKIRNDIKRNIHIVKNPNEKAETENVVIKVVKIEHESEIEKN
jgi:ribulose kinase